MLYLWRGEFMPRGKSSQDPSILAMALVGYEMEKKKIDEKIKELRVRLGGGSSTARVGRPPATETAAPKKRQLSAAARKRIASAQKKRWAEHRKAVAQAAKEESKK
jgi:hypothetical protein